MRLKTLSLVLPCFLFLMTFAFSAFQDQADAQPLDTRPLHLEGVVTQSIECGGDLDMSNCGLRIRVERVLSGDQALVGKEMTVVTSIFSVALRCSGADVYDAQVGDKVEVLGFPGFSAGSTVPDSVGACDAGEYVRKLATPTSPPSIGTLTAACSGAKLGSGLVKFEDHSSGNIFSWHWDFGDGSSCPAQCDAVTGGGQNASGDPRSPIHRYSGKKDDYIATLTVTDVSGRSGTGSCRVILGDPPILIVLDENGNDLIDQPELFRAMDFWVSGQPLPYTEHQSQRTIDDKLFYQIMDMYIHQTPIKTLVSESTRGTASPASLKVLPNRSAPIAVITSESVNTSLLKVDLFDLSGKEILHQEGAGTMMTMKLTDRSGKALPNGVYLFVIRTQRSDGSIVSSGVKRLLILR